ncbi:hypothetical protein WR25_24884 [Diploscapter pachys]|uniref:Uncharacterized protein n=1 Tax=Diploscapter pachys TaxID=2018661 RepID=A0A2A2LHT2_9BILA|nr:hypothetical protein WR25_24884 [Diploscapter pachys]
MTESKFENKGGDQRVLIDIEQSDGGNTSGSGVFARDSSNSQAQIKMTSIDKEGAVRDAKVKLIMAFYITYQIMLTYHIFLSFYNSLPLRAVNGVTDRYPEWTHNVTMVIYISLSILAAVLYFSKMFFFALAIELARCMQVFSAIVLFCDLTSSYVPFALLHNVATVCGWLLVGCLRGTKLENVLDRRAPMATLQSAKFDNGESPEVTLSVEQSGNQVEDAINTKLKQIANAKRQKKANDIWFKFIIGFYIAYQLITVILVFQVMMTALPRVSEQDDDTSHTYHKPQWYHYMSLTIYSYVSVLSWVYYFSKMYSVSLVCEITRNLQAFSSILLFNDLNNRFVPLVLLHSILTVFFWLVIGCACGRRFNNMLDSRTRLMRNA